MQSLANFQHGDGTIDGVQKPQHELQESGFTTSVWADDDRIASFGNGKLDIVEDLC